MFEPNKADDCQAPSNFFSHDVCLRKLNPSSCCSTDSDSGCKFSEEPSSSFPDTESLLTFSSCNLSVSEKLEETYSETSTVLAINSWKESPKATKTLALSPAVALNQPSHSNFLKSNTYEINSLEELKYNAKSQKPWLRQRTDKEPSAKCVETDLPRVRKTQTNLTCNFTDDASKLKNKSPNSTVYNRGKSDMNQTTSISRSREIYLGSVPFYAVRTAQHKHELNNIKRLHVYLALIGK